MGHTDGGYVGHTHGGDAYRYNVASGGDSSKRKPRDSDYEDARTIRLNASRSYVATEHGRSSLELQLSDEATQTDAPVQTTTASNIFLFINIYTQIIYIYI